MSNFKETIEEVLRSLSEAKDQADDAYSSAEEASGNASSAEQYASAAMSEVEEAISTLADIEPPEAELTDEGKERILSVVAEAVRAALDGLADEEEEEEEEECDE